MIKMNIEYAKTLSKRYNQCFFNHLMDFKKDLEMTYNCWKILNINLNVIVVKKLKH
jgi:hypothetical protein